MSSNELFIKNKSEKHLYNNSDKSKVERYEEEYESSYSPNKHKNNHVFSSLSFKSYQNDEDSNKKNNTENIGQDDINSKSKNIMFADKIYSNDEHLDKKKSSKKKNSSQLYLINMNKLLLSNNSQKHINIQQTEIAKQDIPQSIKKKSLFYIYPPKIEEEKKNNLFLN